jgi:glutamine amidotransferase
MSNRNGQTFGGLKVTLVDYGYGNIRSVSRALTKAGVTPVISGDPRELINADAAVVPGVGAADSAMKALERLGLADALRRFIESRRQLLGICMGQQLLMDWTEEGDVPCLGVVPGTAKLLPAGQKVPHMGWNSVEFVAPHPILDGIPNSSYFYFVHSYYTQPDDTSAMVGMTDYGVRFCSMLAKGNVTATQFHPEKSGPLGLRMYDNFVRLVAEG